MIMNGDTGMKWEERVVACFEKPFRYLVEGADKIAITGLQTVTQSVYLCPKLIEK